MKRRWTISVILAASAATVAGGAVLVSQVTTPGDTRQNAQRRTSVESDGDGSGEVFATNQGAMQSIRGIKGIDAVMLQNLEAVLRMQAPPPPPTDGGGRAAAALLTLESDEPPDPEAEPDGREELHEFEMEGS